MKPHEFWNCTYRELTEYVNSNTLQSEQILKENVILCDALCDKLIDVFAKKRPKRKSLVRDTFKNLFKKELEPHQQTPEEQIRILRSMK